MRLTRETAAVSGGAGGEQVTFPEGERRLRIGCGAGVCAPCVAQSGVMVITDCQRPRFPSLPPLSFGRAGKLVARSSIWARPLPTEGPSQGPTLLSAPFCESNVITDGNGAFSFSLGLRGPGSFIRFPRHWSEAGGCIGLFFFSLFSF